MQQVNTCILTLVLILFLSLSYFFTLLLVSLNAKPTSSLSFSKAAARSWRAFASREYMIRSASDLLQRARTRGYLRFEIYLFTKLDKHA